MGRQITQNQETGELILPFDNPHKGVGQRTSDTTIGLVSGRSRSGSKFTQEQLNEMLAVNGLEWGGPEDGVALGATYDAATLDQRVRSGYYNELDTPEELLARVRGKLAECTDPNDTAIGQSIVDTLKFDGELGLSEEQRAWVPKPLTYAERRTTLEAKIQPMLDTVDASLPKELAEEIDNDFEHLVDAGGTGPLPTTRPGLFKRLMSWMWPEPQVTDETVFVEAGHENTTRR